MKTRPRARSHEAHESESELHAVAATANGHEDREQPLHDHHALTVGTPAGCALGAAVGRFAERVEGGGRELAHFIEKQHAAVGHADLT